MSVYARKQRSRRSQAAYQRALQRFKPMFAVNVQTGQITLNRLKEALGYDYSK